MTEIIGVKFKNGGKEYYFDPKGIPVQKGQAVIVETGRGMDYGVCVQSNIQVPDQQIVAPLRPLVRLASQDDVRRHEELSEKEKTALAVCQEKVAEHNLDMKLIRAEYSFDGNKIIFFFTSENRVDFRALVRDLAQHFHTRIELRQVGVRDEAKLLGGLGVCGKPFCCSQFMNDFLPVSIKMAKTQNLSLNPTKISGTCGRLMCCLNYEQEAYEDAVKRCPKRDSFVETPDGPGNVDSVNLLREQVKVKLDDSTEAPRTYRTCELRVIRSGKGKRPEDYVAPPKEELEKLRYVDPDAPKRPSRPTGERTALGEALERVFSQSDEKAAPKPPKAKEQGEERPHRRNRGGYRHRHNRGGGGKSQ